MTLTNPDQSRRVQILRAALRLLAHTPIEKLSTRQIAREVGVSQPALFRHFRSREALLRAVVDWCRGEMGARLELLLEQQTDPALRLVGLARVLGDFAAAEPGLPRLLFAAGPQVGTELHGALRALAAMQRALVQAIVSEGQLVGLLRRDLDAAWISASLIALLQGTFLQRQLDGAPPANAEDCEASVDLLLRGLLADPGEEAQAEPEAPSSRIALVELDARPILARGEDPFFAIQAALAPLGPGSVLLLQTPFRPAPLLGLLRSQGHRLELEQLDERHWILLVILGDATPVLDLRGLEAPEPLEQVLLHAEALRSGQRFLARTPRLPRLLLTRLGDLDVRCEALQDPAGAGLVLVWVPR